MSIEHWWNDNDRPRLKYSETTCHSTTLSTTNSTWTGLGLNPGLHRDRVVTDNLGHGTALYSVKF
jgi:hypothetical protein